MCMLGKGNLILVDQTRKRHSPMTDLTPQSSSLALSSCVPLALYLSSLSNPDRFPAFISEAKLLKTELTRGSIYGSQVSQQDVGTEHMFI